MAIDHNIEGIIQSSQPQQPGDDKEWIDLLYDSVPGQSMEEHHVVKGETTKATL